MEVGNHSEHGPGLVAADDGLPGENRVTEVPHHQHAAAVVAVPRAGDRMSHRRGQAVEAALRDGVDALAAFGAVGFHAQAQEELGRWLVTQGRADEARSLLATARATYADIGAAGWLTRLDSYQATREQSPTSSLTHRQVTAR